MNNEVFNKLSETLDKNVLLENQYSNVEKSERLVSIGTGAFITLKGLTNVFSHPWMAIAELGVGGTLLYRGITGYCAVKDQLEHSNANTNDVRVPQSAMPTEIY